jgi:hypothetical protein
MPFNIESFRNNIAGFEYLQTNRFELFIRDPVINSPIVSNNGNLMDLLRFRCSAMTVPGLELMAAEVQRYGIGPAQKQPINGKFNDFNVSIICDIEGKIWKFWHTWINSIFNYCPIDNNGTYRHAPYTAEYKRDYVTNMQGKVYDIYGTESVDINFYDAYPISIKEIPLNWEDVNNLIRLDIIITYKEFNINVYETPTNDPITKK